MLPYRKMYPYVEEPMRFRRPLQRGCLDNDYDPQVSHEPDGVGCYIGRVLGQFCGHVSFSKAQSTGICSEDPLSLLHSARRKRRYVSTTVHKRPPARRWK